MAYVDLGGLGRVVDEFGKDLLPDGEGLDEVSKTLEGRVIAGARIEDERRFWCVHAVSAPSPARPQRSAMR